MGKMKHQKIFRLFGVSLFFNLLLPGFLCHAPAQPPSDPAPLQADVETEDQTQAPKGQTFYKWNDENGNLFLTDDLAKVPKRFRDQVETFDLLPPQDEKETGTEREVSEGEEHPALSSPPVTELDREPKKQDEVPPEPYVYKEVPFNQFIHITVGMDEAEVLSRLGFPSLVTPGDYFYGERARYRHRIIRLIYMGDRDLKQKTTVIEIRNGRVVNIERIFPF